ncbi:MAG: hypothetical protein K0R39_3764 [Symbiobacteriaceae bacterium]|jgi:hypothetical protein|nr:hypothetical protein [Symbiobacteriaceae bacterium]
MARKVALCLLLVMLMTGCAVRSVRTPPLPNNGPDVARGLLPLGNCVVTADRILTENFEKLVADSVMIVDAEMGPMTGTRNMARRGNGPDPDLMIEGVDFQVNVRAYIKGTGPATLTISLIRSDKQAGEALACPYSDYVEPAEGSRWILFLMTSKEMPDLALPAGYPWRYAVTDGRASPDLRSGGAMERFPAMPVEDLLALLKR